MGIDSAGTPVLFDEVSCMGMQKDSINQAISALRRGGAVVFPTDTVYGLGVSVRAAKTPDILFRLKGRERGKPIAWLVESSEDLMRWGADIPPWAAAAAQAFWPGPLTLIVRAGSCVPAAFRSCENTIGLRMPHNHTALSLIRGVGGPLATTSANMSGQAAVCSFDALDPLILQRVPVVVTNQEDGEKAGIPSTVIDCTKNIPLVVRAGAIPVSVIEALM